MSTEAAAASAGIVYEHPLNERARTLLRLEFLVQRGRFGAAGDTQWHSRLAIEALMDIVSLLSRGDLRSDIQKELDRVTSSLDGLKAMPGVDSSRLDHVLDECRELRGHLRAAPPGIPSIIRDNEFLGTIEQRAGILGGTCGFDLPSYHLWLNRSPEARRDDLESWFGAFRLLSQTTELVLRLLRDSASPTAEVAKGGIYQTNLDRATPYQLLRVILPEDTAYFPEISGNRHFCTLRFMAQSDAGERPQQTESDIEFRLERCVI